MQVGILKWTLFLYRLLFIFFIAFVIYAKFSADRIMLILTTGLLAEELVLFWQKNDEESKIRLSFSNFSLAIHPYQLKVIVVVAAFAFVYYGNLVNMRTDEELKVKIKAVVSDELDTALPKEDESQKVKSVQDLLADANSDYYVGNYENVLKTLDLIKTDDPVILEKKAYFKILTVFNVLLDKQKNYASINKSELDELSGLFLRYLGEHKENVKFSVVYYHYGQFQLRLLKDESEALGVFDDVIKNHWYSEWIQGSLYYSSLLHYKRHEPVDVEIAIRQMKILLKSSGSLKLFETGGTVTPHRVVGQILREWGVKDSELVMAEE